MDMIVVLVLTGVGSVTFSSAFDNVGPDVVGPNVAVVRMESVAECEAFGPTLAEHMDSWLERGSDASVLASWQVAFECIEIEQGQAPPRR